MSSEGEDRSLSLEGRALSPDHRALSPDHRALSPEDRALSLSKGTRRYRSTVALTLAVLVVALVGLTAANVVQGPRLISAEVSPRATVERVGQRLVLRLDQPVGANPSVTVTPSVPITVTTEGPALTVRFGALLSYATSYAVVARLHGTATGVDSAIRYTLATPAADAFTLERAAPGSPNDTTDTITRGALGAARTVVRRLPRIQEYAVAEPQLAVITQGDDGLGALTVGPLSGPGPAATLLRHATTSQLQSSGPAGIFGFVTSGEDDAGTPRLELYDPVAGGGTVEVKGLDGQPIDPQQWLFVPGTTSVVVQTADASVFLIDPFNGAPTRPLGSHIRLHGFVPGTTTLIVEDPDAYEALDLTKGTTAKLPAPQLPSSQGIAQLLPLSRPDSYVALVFGTSDAGLRYSVATISGRSLTPVYAAPADQLVRAVCLSPNGEYAAVEISPADAGSDGYPVARGYVGAATVFVGLATRAVSAPMPGFAVDWCN